MNEGLPKAGSFQLLRWFSILSLLCIILITAVSAVLMARFLSHYVLDRDAIVTMELIEGVVQAANEAHAHEPQAQHKHLTTQLGIHPMIAIDHYLAGNTGRLAGHNFDAHSGLREFFELLGQLKDVLRVNIYNEDRSIVWSTTKELVGKRFDDNVELEMAFFGEPLAKEFIPQNQEKAEHQFFSEPGSRIVENYLPIWVDGRSRVAGVVEIYKSPRALFQAIDRARYLVWTSAVIGGLFLYLVLFWIVQRADHTLQDQQIQLIESARMATVGEMSSAVAHSIRNPLSAIRSSAELAIESDSLIAAKEAARDVTMEVDRLGEWIRELLMFSRIENGDITSVSVSEATKVVLDGFAHRMEMQGVTLERNGDEPLPPIRGDKGLLEQIVGSLISNAVDAMPEGGRLEVVTCRAGGVVTLTIADTGEGIPKSHIAKIFRPFFTSKINGLGLGLPLARRLTERLGGRMSLTSRVGAGTSIELKFPIYS